jgi:hypothetical protein
MLWKSARAKDSVELNFAINIFMMLLAAAIML